MRHKPFIFWHQPCHAKPECVSMPKHEKRFRVTVEGIDTERDSEPFRTRIKDVPADTLQRVVGRFLAEEPDHVRRIVSTSRSFKRPRKICREAR
jgi:uncharacterized protein (DUF2384 family)